MLFAAILLRFLEIGQMRRFRKNNRQTDHDKGVVQKVLHAGPNRPTITERGGDYYLWPFRDFG